MARVEISECPSCHRKQGEKHVATIKAPTVAAMEKWMENGVAKATDGCRVEPDGNCPHGHNSWLKILNCI